MAGDPFPEVHIISVRNRTFKAEVLVLDNHHYEGCTFTKCKFLWSGGPVELVNDQFHECFWEYTGHAAYIGKFMQILDRGMKTGNT